MKSSQHSLPVWLTQTDDGVQISIHAQPGAKRTSVVGEYNNRLKIALNAPPVDGKANAQMQKFLSDLCNIPKSCVVLLNGQTSREKKFLLRGMQATSLLTLLNVSPK